MICKNCGQDNKEGYLFCEYCGTDLRTWAELNNDQTINNAQYINNSTIVESPKKKKNKSNKQKKKSRKKIVVILAAVLVVLLAVGGVTGYILYRNAHLLEKLEGSSELTSAELEKTDVEGEYILSQNIDQIKGKSEFNYTPKKIEYSVETTDDYVVFSGEMDYEDEWEFKNEGLVLGVNYLKITFKFSGDNNASVMYVINNICEDNYNKLAIKDQDSDADGLTDYFEIANSHTDPKVADSDGNGVADGEEDLDNDGIKNSEECKSGSDCHRSDSDYDGISDIDEMNMGTSPYMDDTDGDGVIDSIETQVGLNPNDSSDGNSTVTCSKEKDFKSGIDVSVDLTTNAQNVSTFDIYEIPESYDISPKNIEGMVGRGICFYLEGDVESADVSITIDDENYQEGQDYYLIYVNDKTGEFELVENQEQNGNVIDAKLAHFSRYFVSEKKEAQRGVDYVTDENLKALYDSYEEYVADIYKGEAVLSINIRVVDVDNDKALALKSDSGDDTGHTWLSYYYDGNSDNSITPELKLNVLDDRVDDGTVFGAFGFTGDINYSFDKIFLGWDGELKLPSGYRELRYNSEPHQLETKDYDDNIGPEEMEMAYISMPFIVDEENVDLLREFIDGYYESFNLIKNNCTTFAKKALEYSEVNNKINYNYTKMDLNLDPVSYFPNTLVYGAGNPASTSRSIQIKYPNTHVYRLYDENAGSEDDPSAYKFTSKMAQAMAGNNEFDSDVLTESEKDLELPEENEEETNNVDWKAALIDYINNFEGDINYENYSGDRSISIVYLDDDEIPEIIFNYEIEMSFSYIGVFNGKEVKNYRLLHDVWCNNGYIGTAYGRGSTCEYLFGKVENGVFYKTESGWKDMSSEMNPPFVGYWCEYPDGTEYNNDEWWDEITQQPYSVSSSDEWNRLQEETFETRIGSGDTHQYKVNQTTYTKEEAIEYIMNLGNSESEKSEPENTNDYNDVVTEKKVRESLRVPDEAEIDIKYGGESLHEGSNTMCVWVEVTGKGSYSGYSGSAFLSLEDGSAVHNILAFDQY